MWPDIPSILQRIAGEGSRTTARPVVMLREKRGYFRRVHLKHRRHKATVNRRHPHPAVTPALDVSSRWWKSNAVLKLGPFAGVSGAARDVFAKRQDSHHAQNGGNQAQQQYSSFHESQTTLSACGATRLKEKCAAGNRCCSHRAAPRSKPRPSPVLMSENSPIGRFR